MGLHGAILNGYKAKMFVIEVSEAWMCVSRDGVDSVPVNRCFSLVLCVYFGAGRENDAGDVASSCSCNVTGVFCLQRIVWPQNT